IEQARGGRFDMRGKLSNLVAQAIEYCAINVIGPANFHGESPFAGATLHPSFGGTRKGREATIAARSTIFRRKHRGCRLGASSSCWDNISPVVSDALRSPRAKLSSGNLSNLSN